jgi:ankyrin repeat protein
LKELFIIFVILLLITNLQSSMDTEVWNEIVTELAKIKLPIFNTNQRKFVIKVYKNDFQYVKKNYELINDRIKCLLASVAFVTTVDMLEFIIDKLQQVARNNTLNNAVDELGNNCLMIACYINRNIAVIKYLVEETKMDLEYCNIRSENCLTLACRNNTNLEIIKYLIEETTIPITQVDKYYRDCLMQACYKNSNVSIIKYLIEDVKMYVTNQDAKKNNCLLLACYENTSLDVIKYLIEDRKMDTTYINCANMSCLEAACLENPNLNIIKYLIENVHMNINYLTPKGHYNCLLFACKSNNVELVKYLIEVHKMDFTCTNTKGENCLTLSCIHNKDYRVAKYLLENCSLELQLDKIDKMKFDRFLCLLSMFSECVMNYFSFNNFIETFVMDYGEDQISIIKNTINPILFSEDVCNLIGATHQFGNECTYKEFVNNVRKLKGGICFSIFKNQIYENEINDYKRIIADFTEKPMVLFNHNGMDYYGNRDIVYEKIHVFNGLKEYDLSEPIILNVDVPKYIMLLYVQSCYDGIFDINEIKTEDFHQFLNLIDQYPTEYLSITILESSLIDYMISKKIPFDDHIGKICDRYRLKYLYLYGNQKKIVSLKEMV